jgi:hypothetical protein
MRLAASALLLAVLVAGCDSKSSSTQARTTTTASTCFNHVVGTAPSEGIDWAAEGRNCVRGLIEEELKGTGMMTIRCERLHRGRASCRADWTDSTSAYCTGEFNIHVYGTFAERLVEVSDGPVICSTV